MPEDKSASKSARWLERQFATPGAPVDAAVRRARKNPELVDSMVASLDSANTPLKYGAAKALWQLAKEAPEMVYPYFDYLLGRLDHENNIMRWCAAATLSHLGPADHENRLEDCLTRYLSYINGPKMIMAAHVMAGGAEIAAAKPHLATRIAKAILEVENGSFETEMCGKIAVGHALTALTSMLLLIEDAKPVFDFARRNLDNPRPAVRKKAEKLLRNATAKPRRKAAAAK